MPFTGKATYTAGSMLPEIAEDVADIVSIVSPYETPLLDLLGERDATADADGLLDKVLNMAACKAAIKAGQKLSDGEIEQLLADKEIIEHSSRCPHGRPTAIRFTISELERQFKRK